ncbi:Vms1/Ankzf1 family peptidyl-tRNA hydrolase [Micromonospora sp. WMMD882]|uniref:baeRF2 domain-containing protein n=1 Tax=Micromonospora sp. WMMD882 TaxID=3015151 RepID=UPI00248C55E0|nr:Vms1/Ankzf1 family peptidyl-tRNA hydrolase [Micromonospora sp. WMMD882]WBB77923.1 Vms1/Ankzf1 family peptidyl-tRNA hydrolase [Micromonospora sp. WMMD882]
MTSPTAVRRPPPIAEPGAHLFRTGGPTVSVYLNTEGTAPNAAQQVEQRWRTMRRQLTDDGAPEAALAAVDPLTVGAHTNGRTLAAIADADGLLYQAHLPEPPERDQGTVAALPCLAPLVAATGKLVPYVVVATDRLGADLLVVLPHEPDRHAQVEGDDLHVTRSAPGGWSQRRFQQRAENRWESNAGEVADKLTRLVDRYDPRLVVVSGDVRAVQFLRDQVPDRVRGLLSEVSGEHSSPEAVLRHADQVVEAHVDAERATVLADYERELGQNDRATEGAADTLAALNRGQVDTLLLDPSRVGDTHAWYGPGPAEVADSGTALRTAGVAGPRRGPLVDVAIRAALATDAAVRVVPAGTGQVARTGIGALLRYA